MFFFVLEILIKLWAFGPVNFFRSSSEHKLEAIVAFTCFVRERQEFISN